MLCLEIKLTNPVIVRVQDEGHLLHPSISEPLLPVDVLALEPLAGSIEVIDRNTDMAKALRLVVAIMVDRPLLLLGAIVPRQLQQALHLRRPRRRLLRISQEIQVKARLLVLRRPNQRHAHDVLIEGQCLLDILDADHRVVEAVGIGVRGLDVRRFLHVVGRDDLHPVAVRVERERDVAHAAVGQLLLELVAGVFDARAGCLDVVDADADVAEAAVGFGVAVGDLEVGVVLASICRSKRAKLVYTNGDSCE